MASFYGHVCLAWFGIPLLLLATASDCLTVRDFMPTTCVMLMDTLVDLSTNINEQTTPATAADVLGIGKFCANHLSTVTCLAENVYEMRHSESPFVWACGFLYKRRQAFLLTTRLCSIYMKRKYDFRCLNVESKEIQRCKSRIREGLQYIRDNMPQDLSVTKKRETICSVFQPIIPCIEKELADRCDSDVTDAIVKTIQIFSGSNCTREIMKEKNDSFSTRFFKSFPLTKCGLSEYSFISSGRFDIRKHYKSVTHVCKSLDSIISCLRKTLNNPVTVIDEVISKTFDIDSTEKSFRIICSTKSLITANSECLHSLDEYGKFCTDFIRGNGFVDALFTNRVGSDELDTCSLFEDFINCISIQISRCSLPLADSFRRAKIITLPKICEKREHETGPFGGSVLVHCGVPLATEIQGHMGAVGSSYTIIQVLDYLMHFSCGEIDNYMTCVKRYLYSSSNMLDELLQDIVDFSDLNKMKKTLKTVCKRSDRINQRMSCFLQHTSKFEHCGKLALITLDTDMRNLSLLGEQKTRQKFCKDIKTMTNCAIKLIDSCDPDLGKLAYKTKNALFRHNDRCDKLTHHQTQSAVNIQPNIFIVYLLTLFCVSIL